MTTEKYYYIYKITNLVNNKIYIGKRTSKVDPEIDTQYMGSGKLIKRAIQKYGITNFKKEILELCSKENINEREKYYINLEKCRNKNIGYNITEGGDGVGEICSHMKTYYNKNTDTEIRLMYNEKVPEGYTVGRRPFTEEHKRKTANKGTHNGMFGVHRSGEDNPFFGKSHSKETKEAISKIQKGHRSIINPETLEIKSLFSNQEIPEGFMLSVEYYKKKKEENKKTESELKKSWSKKRKEFWENKDKEVCPWCGKMGRGVGFYRWHMDNCKEHPNFGKQNKLKFEKQISEHGKKLKGRTGTTSGLICITDGLTNKFVPPEEINKYPNFHKGMTKKV